MPVNELADYRYRGARALVLLHERALRELLPVWRRAKAANVRLPQTTDPHYVSLEALLSHPLRSARGYMTWLCEKLGLPDPGIDPSPEPEPGRAGGRPVPRAPSRALAAAVGRRRGREVQGDVQDALGRGHELRRDAGARRHASHPPPVPTGGAPRGTRKPGKDVKSARAALRWPRWSSAIRISFPSRMDFWIAMLMRTILSPFSASGCGGPASGGPKARPGAALFFVTAIL